MKLRVVVGDELLSVRAFAAENLAGAGPHALVVDAEDPNRLVQIASFEGLLSEPHAEAFVQLQARRAGGAGRLAQKMFQAYNDQGPNPWKTFDGRSVPTWDQISDQVRAKWIAAAEAAL